jgi:putative transposase
MAAMTELAALVGTAPACQALAVPRATLLDEGRYLCSVPTMYRLLRAAGEIRERRD